MNASPSCGALPVRYERDPVALFVEEQLLEIARFSGVEADLNQAESGEIVLRFDNVVVRGECRDIALLRLASALLEDERFTVHLTRSLGPRFKSESMAQASN